MFDLAIHSKSRACELITLRVGYVASNGHAGDSNHPPEKTGRPVPFELTEVTAGAGEEA
jgi:hypothetical protein